MPKLSTALSLLLLCLTFLLSAQSFVITIAPRSQECFFEDLEMKERMMASYEVISGGMLDINIRVTGPDGKVVYEQEREKDGSIQFYALMKGSYQVCFSNSMSTMTSKMISFNIYAGHDLHRVQNAKKDAIEPLDQAAIVVTESVRKLRDAYSYLRVRLVSCQATLNNNSDIVFFWGFANLILAVVGLLLRTVFIVWPFKGKSGPGGVVMGGNMQGYGSRPQGGFQQFNGI